MTSMGRVWAVLSSAAGLVWAAPADAQQQQWAAAYVEWTVEGTQSAETAAQDMWVPEPATASFFTLNWDFTTGEGGYIGLQTDPAGAGNARFSIWNTTEARGAACRPFDGEGEGMTCVAPLSIRPDAVYRVRVSRGEADAEGQWWVGWLQEPGGAEREIGAIRTPLQHREITVEGLHNFSEFWGDRIKACRDAPLSVAGFGPPEVQRAGREASVASSPTGTRPLENNCRTGGERLGAAVSHEPLILNGAPGMLVALGGAPSANAVRAKALAAEPPVNSPAMEP